MMRLLVAILVGTSVIPAVADGSCEPAVDAADSMNVNQSGCDYSDKGLNGFLQKAFKKGEEGAVLETDSVQKAASQSSHQASASGPLQVSDHFVLSISVDQWSDLPESRAKLLPKALARCGKGFAVIGEQYRSAAMGRIDLTLTFECKN